MTSKNDGIKLYLVNNLECRVDAHSRLADPDVLEAANRFINLIKQSTTGVLISKQGSSTWGRVPLLKEFASIFDPLLTRFLPAGSVGRIEFELGGARLPMKQYLEKDKLKPFAESLKSTAQEMEGYHSLDRDDGVAMVGVIESLSLVAELLDGMRDCLPNPPINWCSACFRRSQPNKKYCSEHKPSFLNEIDTIYRKSKRIRKAMNPETLSKWKIYKAQRKVMGESIVLLAEAYDQLSLNSTSQNAIIATENDSRLVYDTLNRDWADVAHIWSTRMSTDYPICTNLLNKSANEFTSWKSFARELLDSIKDRDELTTHPFWILNILDCAEEWFAAEKHKKISKRAEEIIKLYQSGLKNQAEIGRRTECKRPYVNKILKKYGLIPSL